MLKLTRYYGMFHLTQQNKETILLPTYFNRHTSLKGKHMQTTPIATPIHLDTKWSKFINIISFPISINRSTIHPPRGLNYTLCELVSLVKVLKLEISYRVIIS